MKTMTIQYNNFHKALDSALGLASKDDVLLVIYPDTFAEAFGTACHLILQYMLDRQVFYTRLKFAISVPGVTAISDEDDSFFDYIFLPNDGVNR